MKLVFFFCICQCILFVTTISIITGDDFNKFKDDDYKLYLQILDVDFYIDDINRLLQASSPKFSLDLQKPERRDRYPQIIYTSVYNMNFSLYRDGVYPKPEIAKLCLNRITRLIRQYCYN